MAEFLARELRVNEAVENLTALQAAARNRVQSIPAARGFTTTPDGRVLNASGVVIYTPTKVTEANKP
jgi:hypothetical protein